MRPDYDVERAILSTLDELSALGAEAKEEWVKAHVDKLNRLPSQ